MPEPINHGDHTHDRDPAAECACGEIVRDPAHHTCLPIGWIDSWQLIGNPPEAYIPLTQEERP